MAEYNRDRPHHQLQVHSQPGGGRSDGPSASQVIAVATLLPVSGALLALAGITVVGTLVALAVAAPLFVLFSPVLVPATLTTGMAIAAFLASGAFGVTGMCSLSQALKCLRWEVPEQMELAKRRAADVAAYAGQKTEEAGRTIQHKAHETGGRIFFYS